LWGHPTKFDEITSLFARFCSGELKALPWSDQPVAVETSVISKQLAQINQLGFLTINSQPAVNGLRSDDKIFGWGPSNGYVYQKAYLEFFVNPLLLSVLLEQLEKDPNITYYVINKRGDLRTNTRSDGPNAVTWGVFPGKEIVQPTIVEALSFMAWKDEAYELGQQWGLFYEPDSPSRKLITDLMEASYLVNVVHNNFLDSDAIFKPFWKAGTQYQAIKTNANAVNGVNKH
jgi:methylenetetrahydrofolate reductase (NADPH)